jgi:hypothetical protein
MMGSAKETSSSYALGWTLDDAKLDGDGGAAMKLTYEIAAFEELYVADRLWDFDAARKRVPDPFGVYRFVEHGSLRLLFGQAPIPPHVKPHIVYQPLYSRVRAGETHRGEVLIKLPVDEYSSLGRNVDGPTDLDVVSRVVLIVEFRLRATMEADPEPPLNESGDVAGYIVHGPKHVVSSMETPNIPVKRRQLPMARVVLAGDPQPGLKLRL